MNYRINNIFLLIKNNKVVSCESNLKDLINLLPEEIKGIRSYDYFYRNFKKTNYFQFKFNKDFYFQKIDYNQDV